MSPTPGRRPGSGRAPAPGLAPGTPPRNGRFDGGSPAC